MAELSPLMKKVLVALLLSEQKNPNRGMTGNEIGAAVGADGVIGGRGLGGRGRGHRVFGAAQRIIPVLTALRKRELIWFATRSDGLSGTAYSLTTLGEKEAQKLTDEAYEMGEAVDPLLDHDRPAFEVGEEVTISEESEMYPGESGVVKGVGRGTGLYQGSIVYDVLIEGTSDPERFAETDIAGDE